MLSAQLVYATPFHLRYRIAQTVDPVPVPGLLDLVAAGGPSPDLITDATAGAAKSTGAVGNKLLKNIMRAQLDGIGSIIPAGPLTTAQVRALLQSDDPGDLVLVNNNVPRAIASVENRAIASPENWAVDALAIGGVMTLRVTTATGLFGSGIYLDIVQQHTLVL